MAPDIAPFPCLCIGPDKDGWYVVTVPGPNVNAQGQTEADAFHDAAEILGELIDEGEPLERWSAERVQASAEEGWRLGEVAPVSARTASGRRIEPILTWPAVVKQIGDGAQCVVPDFELSAARRTLDEAVRAASGMMFSRMTDWAADGRAFPDISPIEEINPAGGTLTLISLPLPQRRDRAA